MKKVGMFLLEEEQYAVYSLESNFDNIGEFLDAVEKFLGKKYKVFNWEIKYCISTEKGIETNKIQPLNNTDISIDSYYIAMWR